jgi:hypothetical protein
MDNMLSYWQCAVKSSFDRSAGDADLVESASLAGAPVDGVYPSDHHAVVCDLRWAAA